MSDKEPKPEPVKMDECAERQCDLCPFITKTKCREWMATRVYK